VDRREFIGVVAVGLLAAPLAAEAQQARRVYRLGILAPTSMPAPSERRTAVILIPSALQELGYVQGQNLVVETRYGEGRLDRLPALARELVQLRPDVIVAIGSAAARAVKNATATIPIVLYANIDPVAAGLVKSLAKPGDNITGILIAPAGTLAAKRLELLKQAVPRAERITFLGWGDDPSSNRAQVQETQEAASSLGVKLSVVEVRGGDYAGAFATIAAERPGALFVAATTYFVRDRKRIIELVAKHRLPAIYEWPEHVEDGGLMSYGSSLIGTTQRVAAYVDRIFKGAKPGDLPVEQPSKFELVINLKTARGLGLTLPQSLVSRADRVIE
jgi:putative tryptophan/tyrosine transport system substrate-binding protein